MKRTTPLRAKTSLRAHTRLRSKAKPKRQPKPSIVPLRNKADYWFAHYIRLRDSVYRSGQWVGRCITCPRQLVVTTWNPETGKWSWTRDNGWGHFIGRGCYLLRYEEENVNLQCSHCNAWRDKQAMLASYTLALDKKYGVGTASSLVALGKRPHNFTVSELTEVIQGAQEYVEGALAETRLGN